MALPFLWVFKPVMTLYDMFKNIFSRLKKNKTSNDVNAYKESEKKETGEIRKVNDL